MNETDIYTLVGLGILIIGILVIIAHWPRSLWEPRDTIDDEETDISYALAAGDDPVFFKPDAYSVEGGAWYFSAYDGTAWGPFKSESVARVNHRNYLLVVDGPVEGT